MRKLDFTMTLQEALRRSPHQAAYAYAPNNGGWLNCGLDLQPRNNVGEDWFSDPETVKWRPIGGESHWLPKSDDEKALDLIAAIMNGPDSDDGGFTIFEAWDSVTEIVSRVREIDEGEDD